MDLHVNFSGHLWGQIARSILIEPLFSQNVENVGIVLIFEALRVELRVGVYNAYEVEEALGKVAPSVASLIVVLKYNVQ